MDLKSKFLEGRPLYHLTTEDQSQLRKATWDMQKKAKDSYYEVMSETSPPLLMGYLKKGNPNRKELGEALLKVKENLNKLLKKAKDPEIDMGLFLSFKPLVEGLLKENKEYCLAAEGARIQAENDGSLENWRMATGGIAAAAPCFIRGPWGAVACLVAGVALGAEGYRQAQVATVESLGRALTGKQFETLAGVSEKEREEILTKLGVPLGAFGTTAVPARAASGAIARAFKPVRSLTERKQLGEECLGRVLNEKQVEELEKAHRVGLGQKGKDGTPARIGNYTQVQLREKNKILKQAGFSKEEIKKLMRDGVIGLKEFFSNFFRGTSKGKQLADNTHQNNSTKPVSVKEPIENIPRPEQLIQRIEGEPLPRSLKENLRDDPDPLLYSIYVQVAAKREAKRILGDLYDDSHADIVTSIYVNKLLNKWDSRYPDEKLIALYKKLSNSTTHKDHLQPLTPDQLKFQEFYSQVRETTSMEDIKALPDLRSLSEDQYRLIPPEQTFNILRNKRYNSDKLSGKQIVNIIVNSGKGSYLHYPLQRIDFEDLPKVLPSLNWSDIQKLTVKQIRSIPPEAFETMGIKEIESMVNPNLPGSVKNNLTDEQISFIRKEFGNDSDVEKWTRPGNRDR